MEIEVGAEWELPVVLAAMPAVCRRLLEVHRPGDDGRCLGCRSQVRPVPGWPCVLHTAAASAQHIAQPPRGGRSDG